MVLMRDRRSSARRKRGWTLCGSWLSRSSLASFFHAAHSTVVSSASKSYNVLEINE